MRDPDGFTAFANAQSRSLFGTAWLPTGDWHASDDLVQEALGRMYRYWHRIDRIENPAADAHTVLVRVFLSQRRRRSSTERPYANCPTRRSGNRIMPSGSRSRTRWRRCPNATAPCSCCAISRIAASSRWPSIWTGAPARSACNRCAHCPGYVTSSARTRPNSYIHDLDWWNTMNLDDELAELMHRAVDTLDPPTDRLVAGGVARGRTLRRRRYITLAAEGVACVLVLVAVAAMTVQLLTARTHGTPASAGTKPSQATATPTAATPKGTVAVTGQVMAQTLLDLLPAELGNVRVIRMAGRSFAGFAAAEVVIDDGHGAAELAISMTYRMPNHRNIVSAECNDATLWGDVVCRILSDGGYLSTSHGGASGSTTKWQVQLGRTDNVQIELTEWNAPAEKDARPTRPNPPLTMSQMTTIVRNRQWQTHVSAVLAARASSLFPTEKQPTPAYTNAPPSAQTTEPSLPHVNQPPSAQLSNPAPALPSPTTPSPLVTLPTAY